MSSTTRFEKEDAYLMQNKVLFEENCVRIKQEKLKKKEFYEAYNRLETVRDKLNYKIMVPIPEPTSNGLPLALMEGLAVHTNEIFIPISSTYYTKGTVLDGMHFCLRQIKEHKQKIRDLEREQKMLLERTAFLQLTTEEEGEINIVEEFDEEQDKLWRQKHSENTKRMKQQEAAERLKEEQNPSRDYLGRLDELEIEELLGEVNITQ